MKHINHDRLLLLMAYDPATGLFTRRASPLSLVGTTQKNGRIHICVDYVIFRAHRLAWFYVHGEWPHGDIDHIDGNPANNAIANLRCVNRSVNMENQRRARADSKLGILGVSQRSQNSYQAAIGVRGVRHSLGSFATAEEAHQAYLTAKRQLHVGCTI